MAADATDTLTRFRINVVPLAAFMFAAFFQQMISNLSNRFAIFVHSRITRLNSAPHPTHQA